MSYPMIHPTTCVDPFVRVRVAPRPPRATDAPPPADVVLVRQDEPLRPHALVVAREEDGLALRRVGRVETDRVELLPVTADARPACVRSGAVLGTVLMRWHAES